MCALLTTEVRGDFWRLVTTLARQRVSEEISAQLVSPLLIGCLTLGWVEIRTEEYVGLHLQQSWVNHETVLAAVTSCTGLCCSYNMVLRTRHVASGEM